MAKFYGKIGFASNEPIEVEPGVWDTPITEAYFYGDVLNDTRTIEVSNNAVDDNINLQNKFSILADDYAYSNHQNMEYIEYNGVLWKIKTAMIQRPRIIIYVGGVYNGDKAAATG